MQTVSNDLKKALSGAPSSPIRASTIPTETANTTNPRIFIPSVRTISGVA